MKTIEIDWSEAPTDATDYNPISCMWYKEENGLMYFWSDAASRWKVGGKRGEYDIGGVSAFVPRIKEVKANLIGSITGVDWSKAPEWATHCHPNNKYFYKLNAEGDFLASADGYGWETFDTIKGWTKGLGIGCVSKEDDLQLETKPKYSSLQELPVGTFVKDAEGDVGLWDGVTLYTLNGEDQEGVLWNKEGIASFIGFTYPHNSGCSIVAYSDRYAGEYVPFTSVVSKKEQVVPEAIEQGWKIKHIKHPDYKCGRDVAVTILYKDIGSNIFAYRYSICSPKDMFSRKQGIEEALKKNPYHLATSKDILFREILTDINKQYSFKSSPEFKDLVRWYKTSI